VGNLSVFVAKSMLSFDGRFVYIELAYAWDADRNAWCWRRKLAKRKRRNANGKGKTLGSPCASNVYVVGDQKVPADLP
jgi:hypothetical protein